MLLQALRSFFYTRQYLEVDTPLRLPVIIPESHIQPFVSEECFLQTSPELCMKLLLAEGNSKIFQICHCFRKEEHGGLHQGEFTMLEWYQAGWNYYDLMGECEELLCELVQLFQNWSGVSTATNILRQGKTISLKPPWQKMTVTEAFQQFGGVSAFQAMEEDCFDEILVEKIEPNLGWDCPLFLYDYPAQLASLARKKTDNPTLAERFELYIAGIELANGFSELIDAEEQADRFAEEISMIKKANGYKVSMPDVLLRSLGKMTETAGIALGVDRLLMLLSGRASIEEVVSFTADDFNVERSLQ